MKYRQKINIRFVECTEKERQEGGERDRRRRETVKKMGSLYLENDSLLFDKTKG